MKTLENCCREVGAQLAGHVKQLGILKRINKHKEGWERKTRPQGQNGTKGSRSEKKSQVCNKQYIRKSTKKWFEMGFVLARISGLQALEHKPNAKEERTKRNREGSRQEGANIAHLIA